MIAMVIVFLSGVIEDSFFSYYVTVDAVARVSVAAAVIAR